VFDHNKKVPCMSADETTAPTQSPPERTTRWRPLHILGALDAVALSLPTTLGAVLLVYVHIGAQHLAAGILAAIVGLVLLHLFSLGSTRPAMFSARLFEATTLAAMLTQLASQLPAWGLPDTPELRLAFLCLIAGGAGVVKGLLYLLRADRLTRYIPAPVFAGFSNSIAALLVISQVSTLSRLLAAGEPAAVMLLVAGLAGASMLALRLRMSKWPAAAVGLALGAAAADLLSLNGWQFTMLSDGGWPSALPVLEADFHALAGAQVPRGALLGFLVVNAGILGIMAFINTTVTMEVIGQQDGQRMVGMAPRLLQALGVALAGAMGSLVLTASQQASGAAQRSVRLRPLTVFWAALLFALVYASGVVLWMPVAAICGVMLADAWFFVDRRSARDLLAWAMRQPLSANARADLALVVAVTLSAVLVNMVAAVVAGIFLGLLLFAMRNARQPVRHVWTGRQMRSNCARPRHEIGALDAASHRIRVFELEGDLFFASATGLYERVDENAGPDQWAVVDWSRARHVDSSVVTAVLRLHDSLPQRGAVLLHAGVRPGTPLAEAMAGALPADALYPDLDHALEAAENALLASLGDAGADAAESLHSSGLLRGLSDADRALVVGVMRQLRVPAGEAVLRAGDPSDEMMLVLDGSASVVVRDARGTPMRLSTVLPGATLGEIGFLDRAPRSADVVAKTDVLLACLDRSHFEQLGQTHPHIVQQLLANIAVELAARLRSVSAMVTARNRA
jgi:SulP family sulfate permease